MVDKSLVKNTFLEGARESKQLIDSLENNFDRAELYRLLFNYPKKWSKRKVKKRGSQDMEFLRIEYGISVAVKSQRIGWRVLNSFS